jgi:hypothetical protein
VATVAPQPPADEAGEIVVYAPSLLVSVTIE